MSRPESIGGRDLAELLEFTPARISNMARDGIIEQDAKGQYPLRETARRLFKWYRGRLGEGRSTAAKAKQEAIHLRNEILRETLRKARGETIDIRDAEQAWAQLVMLARQKFLKLGNKIAPRIPYLKDEAAIEAEIQKQIDEALAELSRPVEYPSMPPAA